MLKKVKKSKGSNTLPNHFVSSDNKVFTGKTSIVKEFNKFFVNVGDNLAKQIPTIENVNVTDYFKERKLCSMYLSPVQESELLKVVNECDGKISTDCDDLSMINVKDIFSSVIKPFLHICNLSFVSGIFPDAMKVAKVKPLYKTGEKSSFTNYRPVSLLPQFSKLLEKLFNSRLENYLEKNNILIDGQYGFRSNRSTSMALLELVEHITTAIDNKEIMVGVFIDLKKAFDTINHKLLLQKLDYYGVRGLCNDWLKSYLCNRKQFVQIDDIKSALLEIVCGVPQGSILGPKLFIMVKVYFVRR